MKKRLTFVLLVGTYGLFAQLGLGTSSPDGALHLDNGTSDTDLILEKDAGTSADMIFHNAGSQAGYIGLNASENILIKNENQDTDIQFVVNDGGSDATVLTADGATGFVGIGTAAPTYKLHIYHDVSNDGILLDRNNASSKKSQVTFAQQGTERYSMGIDYNEDNTRNFFIYDTSIGNIFLIDPDGDVGIGTVSPSYKLHVEGNAATDEVALFYNDGNNTNREGILIQCGPDAASFSGTAYYAIMADGDGTSVGGAYSTNGVVGTYNSSDSTLKTNIVNTEVDGTSVISQLQVRDFHWKTATNKKKTIGFIAQEALEVYPEMVSKNIEKEDGETYYSITVSKLVPLMVKDLQQKQERVRLLEAKLAEKEKDLKKRLENIRASIR